MIRAQRKKSQSASGSGSGGSSGQAIGDGLAIAPERPREITATERDGLAGLLGGFAIMIAAWLVVLSYAPLEWLAENAARGRTSQHR